MASATSYRTVQMNGQTLYVWKDAAGTTRRSLNPPVEISRRDLTDEEKQELIDTEKELDETEKELNDSTDDDDSEENASTESSTTATASVTNSTAGRNPVNRNTSAVSKTSSNKTLKTNFELSGIASDKDIAASGATWNRTPGTGSTKSLVGETLADSLNNAAKQLLQSNIGPNRKSRDNEGFVARSIPTYEDKGLLEQTVAMAFETSGFGGPETQIAQAFARLDRFERGTFLHNTMFSGFTFFSRPRLCLKDWNICANRKLASLRTTDENSIPFAIRCYLDTQYAADSSKSERCPLFDKYNPFLVPFTNRLVSINGFNDPTLATETTDGGFFSEDQTYVIGGDRMSRTYDINVSLRDLPGSPILAMVDYWTEYMAGLTDGSLQQYSDAIDFNRIDYTVSIYRFLTDRTRRFITRWCKCTGCYPVSPPAGITFNKNEGEQMVDAAVNINVPFKVNRIEYDDPVILKEFNILVRRYAGQNIFGSESNIAAFDQLPQNNYSGIPYIRPTNNGYELVWLRRNDLAGEYVVAEPKTGMQSGIINKAIVRNYDKTGASGKAIL